MQAQGFADWELILADDTGDAAALAALAARTLGDDDRLRVVPRSGPGGRSHAMRRGLAAARGRYVVALDDDDTWEPEFLSETVAYLEAPEHAAEIAIATGVRITTERADGAGGWETLEVREELPPAHRLRLSDLLVPRNVQPNALLIRASALAAAGEYPAEHPVAEDWAFHLRLLATGPIGTIPRALARYHLRPGADGRESNAVFTGLHGDFVALVRERELRRMLAAEPTQLGLVLWLEERLARQERRLEALEESLRPVVAIGTFAWRVTAPFRRIWRRLRGRS